jgi:hypothetical protein
MLGALEYPPRFSSSSWSIIPGRSPGRLGYCPRVADREVLEVIVGQALGRPGVPVGALGPADVAVVEQGEPRPGRCRRRRPGTASCRGGPSRWACRRALRIHEHDVRTGRWLTRVRHLAGDRVEPLAGSPLSPRIGSRILESFKRNSRQGHASRGQPWYSLQPDRERRRGPGGSEACATHA